MSTNRVNININVCSPTNNFKDLAILEEFVNDYKKLGGKVPSQIEAALTLAKTGRNMEESLNTACNGLFDFYVTEETRCANKNGFDNLQDFLRSDQYYEDACVLSVMKNWQKNNINYVLGINNSKSIIRSFWEKSIDQVMGIVKSRIKSSVIKNTSK